MKVCTDSCVLGAYVQVADTQRVLDIGAGTGLLSLMVAQRSKAIVETVEINPAAQEQAQENFALSPWSERLTLHPCSLQAFAATYDQQPYDVILSNPPFFLSSLKSPDAAKNAARHAEELFFEEILAFSQKHLSKKGKLYLLLPPSEAGLFARLALHHNLHLAHTLQVFTKVGGKCIRHIQTYTFQPTGHSSDRFYIREENGVDYTSAFADLLRDYYLIF